jgi:hypothetical protein
MRPNRILGRLIYYCNVYVSILMVQYIVSCSFIGEFSIELDSALNVWSCRKVVGKDSIIFPPNICT